VDFDRVLVLRTVSNYDRQPRGISAAESLAAQRVSKFGAYLPSLESAYAVGHAVVSELLKRWPKYLKEVARADQAAPLKP
jgi:purine nucleoside permease